MTKEKTMALGTAGAGQWNQGVKRELHKMLIKLCFLIGCDSSASTNRNQPHQMASGCLTDLMA
jgi:hypothetical protein